MKETEKLPVISVSFIVLGNCLGVASTVNFKWGMTGLMKAYV